MFNNVSELDEIIGFNSSQPLCIHTCLNPNLGSVHSLPLKFRLTHVIPFGQQHMVYG